MIETEQATRIASLPPLSDDERDDAEFRGKDRAWSALVALFEEKKESEGLNYRQLGDRIGRSRKQVQRWLGSSFNMTLQSFGLLAEGLDADVEIDVVPRRPSCPFGNNYVHPSEDARAFVVNSTYVVPAKTPTSATNATFLVISRWQPHAEG